MNRVQASALFVVSLLFASCVGDGAKSEERTWTKQQVIAAANLTPAPGGHVHRRTDCNVSGILTSRDQVQEHAAAAEQVATNPDGSAGVIVDERRRQIVPCLLVMKRELLSLRPAYAPAGSS